MSQGGPAPAPEMGSGELFGCFQIFSEPGQCIGLAQAPVEIPAAAAAAAAGAAPDQPTLVSFKVVMPGTDVQGGVEALAAPMLLTPTRLTATEVQGRLALTKAQQGSLLQVERPLQLVGGEEWALPPPSPETPLHHAGPAVNALPAHPPPAAYLENPGAPVQVSLTQSADNEWQPGSSLWVFQCS